MISRRIYNGLRIGCLVFAAVAFLVAGPGERARLEPADFVVLGGALLLALALSYLRAPSAFFERSVRPTPNAERIALLLPVLTAVFALFGWYEAAAVNVIAHLVAPPGSRRRSPLDRLMTAALRVPIWWLIGPLHDILAAHAATLGLAPLAIFVGANAVWYTLSNFLWLDPLAALKGGRSLWPYWRTHIRDLFSFGQMALELAWGYVAFLIVKRDGAALGMAVLAPTVVIAALLVQLARTRSRVHRLTLSREAVEAMLGAHDPLPQMRSILESIDPRLTRESIEIFGFGRGGSDAWTSVARLGPPPPDAITRSAARALYDLSAHGGGVEGVRGTDGVVIAYAAHDEQKRLLGALVVYRSDGAAAIVSSREFERAAHELAPLLSDFGTITATRTAASVDTLTGLVNRRAVGRAAEEAMAYVRAGGMCALLLIDVDHFKSINDLLGHNAGDRALARIGAIMRENVREGDVAGRFGGEEFIVLMRDADRDRALNVAERLRAAIEHSGVAYADGAPITISVGVSYARITDISSEMLIERADKALYRAKNTGRNRVVESPLLAV
ncbi:MAG: hypothetical protein NVSMB64_26260 [Candidatus Velthaea sp.]